MTELALLHESTVGADEIDSLGHMNVRFYVARVDESNQKLLAQRGIVPATGQALRRVDTYNRFHREQFEGATLNTYGGLISSEGIDASREIRTYFEIRNMDTGQLASTFIVTTSLVDIEAQQVLSLPSALQSMPDDSVQVPEHGAPRSLSLKFPQKIALDVLQEAITEDPTPGMMTGTRENTVYAEDCDAKGRLMEHLDLMAVLFRPAPGQSLQDIGPPLLRDEQGRRYSWAMLETRSVSWERPMAGDTIIALGADITSAEKWRHTRRWMFVKQTGLLLGVSDSLGICIDLDARKSIAMPASMREVIERNCLPQFA